MNATELAERVSKTTGVNLNVTKQVLAGAVEEISTSLSRGEEMSWRNFGLFVRREAPAKMRRLPTRRESDGRFDYGDEMTEMKFPPMGKVAFSACDRLRKLVK